MRDDDDDDDIQKGEKRWQLNEKKKERKRYDLFQQVSNRMKNCFEMKLLFMKDDLS